MSELTSEQLAQRIYECRLLEAKEVDQVLSAAGGRGASLDDFILELLRSEKLTNWQIARVMEGHRRGYFYGNWKVLYLVGAGTFARVYRGSHRKTNDVRAIKVLRSRYSNDDESRDQFTREAKMVMKLRHPNIVPIHEVDVDRGRIYMVMDFVEGQNLRDYVKAHKTLKVSVALNILRDLAAGLAYAAEKGVTHRDMKLSNVLLSAKGQAKLVDFGLATVNKEFEDEVGGSTFNPRSIDYAGLEKVTNVVRNDPRSDIYFLGCMLYHMVAGEPPLFETRERIKRLSPKRYKDIVPITNHNSNLPHRLVILCNRLMELNPENRIQTPALALKEVEGVLEAVKTGRAEKYDEQLTQQHKDEYAALMRTQEEGRGKTVMVVESNIKVQDSLRQRLKELGYKVLIMGNVERALERFDGLDPAEDSPADCVLFGCAGLGRDGIAAFQRFNKMDYCKKLPSILMYKDAYAKYVQQLEPKSINRFLELPIKFPKLRRHLRDLMGIKAPPAAEPKKKNGSLPTAAPVKNTGADA